ncbi:unnamed protein product [Darwinula stevensoni]|uniref:Uncharacterized protein n=1 Tax=Darwinula stevensoni TaxID=69355 RepID=A0A7R8XBF6_9CRUS|nr:unnamed protein product [Darwinula stevensoni]CAG0891181.1 unnamed protein product [Darwinula stevensoni]
MEDVSSLILPVLADSSQQAVNLNSNEIVELTEEIFMPIMLPMEYGHLSVHDNPIECGCSMAWVVLGSFFLNRIGGECKDGMAFQDLDPEIFQDLCVERDPPEEGDYSTWIASRPIGSVSTRRKIEAGSQKRLSS